MRNCVLLPFCFAAVACGSGKAQQPAKTPSAASQHTRASTSVPDAQKRFSNTWWECKVPNDYYIFAFDPDGHAYRIEAESKKRWDPSPDDHWQFAGSTLKWTWGGKSATGSGTLIDGRLRAEFGTDYMLSNGYVSRSDCDQIPNASKQDNLAEGRRWQFTNKFSRGIVLDLRDGSSGTGQECDSNARVDSRSLEPGESAIYACGSHVGFCVRWKYADADAEYTAWSGVACNGSNAIWKRFKDLRIDAF